MISRNGALVAGFGLGVDVSPGDLLQYRREWEPFVAAHLAIWNRLLDGLEKAAGPHCPAGIFPPAALDKTDPTWRPICAALSVTRARVSETDLRGIPKQWNEWQGKSSAEILAGAATMLQWHQDVVRKVGTTYKDELVEIANYLGIEIELPPVPDISIQQHIASQIEGAYIATKGIIQIAGYGFGNELVWAKDQSQALVQGLTDTIKEIPGVVRSPWTWIAITAVAVAVVAGSVVYFVPRPAHR